MMASVLPKQETAAAQPTLRKMQKPTFPKQEPEEQATVAELPSLKKMRSPTFAQQAKVKTETDADDPSPKKQKKEEEAKKEEAKDEVKMEVHEQTKTKKKNAKEEEHLAMVWDAAMAASVAEQIGKWELTKLEAVALVQKSKELKLLQAAHDKRDKQEAKEEEMNAVNQHEMQALFGRVKNEVTAAIEEEDMTVHEALLRLVLVGAVKTFMSSSQKASAVQLFMAAAPENAASDPSMDEESTQSDSEWVLCDCETCVAGRAANVPLREAALARWNKFIAEKKREERVGREAR